MTALLADKAEAAVKGGVADIQKNLIGRRIVPCESGILVLETDNHAHIVAGLSTEQSPGSERNNFSAELLQHSTGLRAVAITSLFIANGCFNDDIRAHTSVLSVVTELNGDDNFSNLFTSFKATVRGGD